MNKKNIAIVLGIAILLIVSLVAWGLKQNTQQSSQQAEQVDFASTLPNAQQQSDVIFYYGKECPHCQNVEKFLKDNKINEKVAYASKEVWHNSDNNNEMQEKAKQCNLSPDNIGVPFLYANGKCYIGEVDVENYFKSQAGVQ